MKVIERKFIEDLKDLCKKYNCCITAEDYKSRVYVEFECNPGEAFEFTIINPYNFVVVDTGKEV